MNGISDTEVVNALRRQMTIAAAKQVAAAGNLANIDTPNYKAVEVSFADALDSQMAAPVATQPGPPRAAATTEPDPNAKEVATRRRGATATPWCSIASCSRWAARRAISAPRRRRWRRSSAWCATPLTRAVA